MKPIALIGGGGHAHSLMEMMPANMVVVGYADSHPVEDMPVPYLGTDEQFLHSDPGMDVQIALVWGSGANMKLRRKLIDLYSSNPSPTLVAPSAMLTPNAKVGKGCAIMHRAVINGAEIGNYCVVNTGAIVEHGAHLADNVFIGPGAVICGGVSIGADTIVGAGATVRNGVTIVPGTVIGMGAAVVADITKPGVYVGVPAKRMVK